MSKILLMVMMVAGAMFGQRVNDVKSIDGVVKRWNGKAWVTVTAGGSISSGTFKWNKSGSTQVQDSLRIIAGSNITLTQSGNSLTITGVSGGGSVGNADSLIGLPGANFLLKADTSALHYVKLAGKVNTSDTSNRWAPKGNYATALDTSALHYVKLAGKVNTSDTSNRWAPKGNYATGGIADTNRIITNDKSQTIVGVKSFSGKPIMISGIEMFGDLNDGTLSANSLSAARNWYLPDITGTGIYCTSTIGYGRTGE